MTKKQRVELANEAERRHTMTVIFDQDSDEELVAIKAKGGKTTKCIARETGLSEAQVQYRVLKSQRQEGKRYRADYRDGQSPLAAIAEQAIFSAARADVQKLVAPAFAPFAARRPNS